MLKIILLAAIFTIAFIMALIFACACVVGSRYEKNNNRIE